RQSKRDLQKSRKTRVDVEWAGVLLHVLRASGQARTDLREKRQSRRFREARDDRRDCEREYEAALVPDQYRDAMTHRSVGRFVGPILAGGGGAALWRPHGRYA